MLSLAIIKYLWFGVSVQAVLFLTDALTLQALHLHNVHRNTLLYLLGEQGIVIGRHLYYYIHVQIIC